MAKGRRRKRSNKQGTTLPIRAVLSGILVLFALAAANLSFLSFARDALAKTVNESIELETVKEIGMEGINSLKSFTANYENGDGSE